VVIEHLPHPVRLQGSEHPVRELDYHVGRRQSGEWETVTHPVTVPNLARLDSRTGLDVSSIHVG
jgi:hypothetical protein